MAYSPSSLQSISALMKQHYLEASKIQNSMIDFGPLTAELLSDADENCDGITIPFPLIYAGGGGFSSSMSAAYNSATPAASVNFLMNRATTFGQVVLGGEALAASENPDGAFISDLVLEVDVKRRRLHEYMAALVYGDGTGAIAQVGTLGNQSSAPGVVALADPALAARFQVNDVVTCTIGSVEAGDLSITNWVLTGALTTATSGAGGTTQAVGYVVGVNIPGGTITLSSTQGGAATSTATIFPGNTYTLATGSFLFFSGDQSTSASTPVAQAGPTNAGNTAANAIIAGLLSWMPLGGPAVGGLGVLAGSTDNQFGVTTRAGNSALYGQVIDATSAGLNLGTIRAALTNAVAQLRQVGSRPRKVFMHPIAFYKLSLELQGQGFYNGSRGQGPSGEGSFGFDSLVLPTDAGSVEVISDPQCLPCMTVASFAPSSGYSGAMTAFILDDNWEVIALGEAPHLDQTDGNYFLRIQGTDNYQIQEKAYWNLGTHRPNGSCAVLLPQ